MTREILFRGNNGQEWIYGDLRHAANGEPMIQEIGGGVSD